MLGPCVSTWDCGELGYKESSPSLDHAQGPSTIAIPVLPVSTSTEASTSKLIFYTVPSHWSAKLPGHIVCTLLRVLWTSMVMVSLWFSSQVCSELEGWVIVWTGSFLFVFSCWNNHGLFLLITICALYTLRIESLERKAHWVKGLVVVVTEPGTALHEPIRCNIYSVRSFHVKFSSFDFCLKWLWIFGHLDENLWGQGLRSQGNWSPDSLKNENPGVCLVHQSDLVSYVAVVTTK